MHSIISLAKSERLVSMVLQRMSKEYIEFEWFLQWTAGTKPKRLAAGSPTTTAGHFGRNKTEKKKTKNPTGSVYLKMSWNIYISTIDKFVLTCSICSATNIYQYVYYVSIYTHTEP